MDQQIKSVWLDKLRSGTVVQAHQVLEDLDNGNKCCLGVLMQCQGKSPYDWASEQASDTEDDHYDDLLHYLQTADLPHSYAAGLTEDEMGLLAALKRWMDNVAECVGILICLCLGMGVGLTIATLVLGIWLGVLELGAHW